MSKQMETTNKLIDRVNALEAICLDLLQLTGLTPPQTRIKFDDYQIKYTQEAIDKREAEVHAKQLSENRRAAVSEFNGIAASHYWKLVFMSKKEQGKHLDAIWLDTTEGLELPNGTKRPDFAVIEPSVDKLIERRAELVSSVDSINLTMENQTIKHNEQSIIDVSQGLEKQCASEVAKLRKDDSTSQAERERLIKETEADYKVRISRHIHKCQSYIESAKVSIKRHEAMQEELEAVNTMLGTQLVNSK